jgi:hypothetical protein
MNKKAIVLFCILILMIIPIFLSEYIPVLFLSVLNAEEEAAKEYCIEITKDCRNACKELDFITAHENLNKLQDKYLSDLKNSTVEGYYFQAVDYIYTQELNYLFYSDESDISQKVIMLLSDFPIIGMAPREGMTKYISSSGTKYYEIKAHSKSVSVYNNVCNKILEHCIDQENKTLAKNIIKKIKSVPYVLSGSSGEVIEGIKFHDYASYVKYDKRPINEAQKKYDSAFN